ncbi:MAG: histidine--tRNA ligase [Firmicutes bacterium]|nr:histidine--tRNA ligase [Bacillota bacterium]
MLTKAPKGTKDVLPEQSVKWQYIEKTFRDICAGYGMKEIRTPVFEHTELFQRGVGDTTDIVQKEMYTFEDHAGRSISLKPEGTAGVVRSYIENKLYADTKPAKFCYLTPCFRYERPQAGRLREFHQLGVEIFGAESMMADAEVVSLAMDFFETLGVGELELRINSIGCPQCRSEYRQALQDFLRKSYNELCDTCKDRFERNPMRILDCKNPDCKKITEGAPRMIDYLCEECSGAFKELKKNLGAMGIEYTVDPGIVRGLDYYTKTAFEIVTNTIGAQGTVCGGGRYDHLVEELGGPATPGIGFGLGIERLLIVMEATGAFLPKEPETDLFIAFVGGEARLYAQGLARKLRKQGFKVMADVAERNMKGQFKYADRVNARFTAVIGEEEIAENRLTLKNMKTSEQKQISAEELIKELKVSE